jgi:hypothetical protein
MKAVVFHRECGATVGANTQVSVIPLASALPNEPGNIAIVDGKLAVHVKWTSEGALQVHGLGSGRVFKREERVDGIAIRYEP